MELYAILATLSLLLTQTQNVLAKMPKNAILKPEISVSQIIPPPAQTNEIPQNIAENRPFKLLPPLFDKISMCESGNRQFYDNGEVVKSRTEDYGLYQINKPIHYLKAKSMGLDIMKPEDNEAYAVYLWSINGYRDWSASKSCWSK